MTDREALRAIYSRIPPVMGCRRGCSDCCGPAPVSAAEADAMRPPLPLQRLADGYVTPPKEGCLTCAFATPEGCSIYADRPILCRLFGAVDTPWMRCPHGARSIRLLSDAEARALITEAHAP